MPKYSDELVDELIGHIVHGDTDLLACEKVGISPRTLNRWLKDEAKVRLSENYARA